MKKLVIVIICFLFLSLKPIQEIDTCDEVAKISSLVASKLKKKGLRVSGTGASLRGGVEKISIFFQKKDLANISQARKIYIEAAEIFISTINQNKVIRPYLHDYPCTDRNIVFLISFKDENGNRPAENYVALVSLSNGIIFYSTYNHQKGEFVKTHQEPYQEALKIVKEEKNNETSTENQML